MHANSIASYIEKMMLLYLVTDIFIEL